MRKTLFCTAALGAALITSSLAMLSGCSTATDLPATADGKRQFFVQCPPLNMPVCTKRAAEECSGEYDVLGSEQGSMQVRCHA